MNNNKLNTPPDVAVNEEIFNTIKAVLSMPESSLNQEVVDQEEEENYENEDKPQEQQQQLVGHFWDSLVKDAKSKSPPTGQHSYNIRSKGLIGTPRASSLNPTKGNNNPQPAKQSLPIQNP